MQGLTGLVVSLIIVATAFLYLWITNPLYAFIGGIVFIVFIIVGYALVKTLSSDKATSAVDPSQHVLPRRTGEFKRIEDIERPEGSWEDLNTPAPPTLEPIPDSEKPKYKKTIEMPQSVPAPAPKIEPPNSTQDFYPLLEEEAPDSAIDELNKALNMEEVEEIEEDLDDDEWVEKITDDVTNSRLLAGVEDLGGFAESIQEQDSFGSAPDDLEDLFQSKQEAPVDTVNQTQFTAYYPRQASAGTNYGFYVYAHLPDALIATDIQQFEEKLGGRVPKAKVSVQEAEIKTGTALSVMIDCDQLKFNQVGAIQRWKAPFVRFDFDFVAHKALIDELIEGRIAILLGMIEIASIDFQIMVAPANPLSTVSAQPQDPLNAIGYDASDSTSVYQNIFVSYSHKDTQIAEQYRKAQMMLGNTIFMDTHSIRAGDDWEEALKRFIDSADVFQLFWSTQSASSEHVRFEWDYALTRRCAETQCVRFIRPVYWEKPLANIPLELGHLHFAFVDVD